MCLMLQSDKVTLLQRIGISACSLSSKSYLRGPKITDSRGVFYVSCDFDEFFIEIDSNRCLKFGSARKKLYLCTDLLI